MKDKQNTKTENGSQSAVVVDRLRRCEIPFREDDKTYLFHRWVDDGMTALIEDSRGCMKTCHRDNIRFLDRE